MKTLVGFVRCGTGFALVALLLVLSSCGDEASNPGNSSSGAPTQQETDAYVANLSTTSAENHLYLHYLRHDNVASEYAAWDVWCWPYSPKSGEGYRFNWMGRVTDLNSPTLEATGTAVIDSFGGACVDIDLTKTYDGGWSYLTQKIGGKPVSFYSEGDTIDTRVGFQIVQSSGRTSGSSFWPNDGGNVYISLSDYALANKNGGVSYHAFFQQDSVQSSLSPTPIVATADPFASDDGTDTTYGKSSYDTADWTDKALQATSPRFLKGDSALAYLKNGAGVGYQILVASFADSDGDGFGDIYGIDQKLDYLVSLGVNVLWLTPIQRSDSYHGYDIADYTQVDPKFGSAVSPAGQSAGKVTSATAMEDYKLLLKDAHAKGMAVIMDLVLNHTSTTNSWFVKSAQLDSNYRGYYQWGNHKTDPTDISEAKFWYPYGDHVYSYYAKFGSSMPELNYSYVSTRQAVETMALNWCSLGVDGFRMDAVKHIFLADEVAAAPKDTIVSDVSTSGDFSSNLTKNLNFWREINATVKAAYPNAFFVGENFDGHAYHVAPYYEGFDSLFDFYSYFNITSAAANARNSSIGSDIQSYDGKDAGSSYTVAGDAALTQGSTSVQYGGTWDLSSVLATDNRYRTGGSAPSSSEGYAFINGAFTSNHDIARCLNRVAGSGDSSGIVAQGNITSGNYADYLKSATCAEIAELMLPGCTWIYYGDELGMSGNFTSGQTATDSYADLAYRQPMKWKQSGKAGDGSFTTGYGITGSGTAASWDSINASSLVPSVEESLSSPHFLALRDFATLKSTSPALIRGTYTPYGWTLNGQEARYVFNVNRKLGNEDYTIVVNFSPTSTLSAGFTGTLAASYNGASLTSLPPLSALAVRNS